MEKDYPFSLSKIFTAVTSTVNRDKIFTVALADICNLISADAAITAFIEMGDENVEVKRTGFYDGHNNGLESWRIAEAKSFAEEVYRKSASSKAESENMEPETKKVNRHLLLQIVFNTGERKRLGVFAVSRQEGKAFSQEDIAFFKLIGGQFGVAVTNARIFEEVLKDGLLCTLEQKNLTGRLLRSQEEERKRIARELHDDTCQSLSNVLLRMDILKAKIPPRLEPARTACDELKETVTKALEDVHQMAFDLRPSMLDDLGLVPAIRWYTKEFKEQSGITVGFELGGEEKKLSSEREIVIFRIVQEALTNIRKHAETEKASVLMDFREDKVIVEVEDRGRGFNVDEALDSSTSRKALGVLGMKERAELLGGNLVIHSSPGTKTLIKLEIPVSFGEGRLYDG